jgi:hypothetical protein
MSITFVVPMGKSFPSAGELHANGCHGLLKTKGHHLFVSDDATAYAADVETLGFPVKKCNCLGKDVSNENPIR